MGYESVSWGRWGRWDGGGGGGGGAEAAHVTVGINSPTGAGSFSITANIIRIIDAPYGFDLSPLYIDVTHSCYRWRICTMKTCSSDLTSNMADVKQVLNKRS